MRKIRIAVRLALCMAALLVLSTNVFAIGIAPGKSELSAAGTIDKIMPLIIFGNGSISVSVDGELAKYIELPYSEVHVEGVEGKHEMYFRLRTENALPPGRYTAKIIAEEPAKGKGTITAKAAVVSKVVLNVYSLSYTARFDVVPSPVDTRFVVRFTNLGTTPINASADITINGSISSSIRTGSKTALAGETREFVAHVSLPPGKYNATAFVGELTLQKEFSIPPTNLHAQPMIISEHKHSENSRTTPFAIFGITASLVLLAAAILRSIRRGNK